MENDLAKIIDGLKTEVGLEHDFERYMSQQKEIVHCKKCGCTFTGYSEEKLNKLRDCRAWRYKLSKLISTLEES